MNDIHPSRWKLKYESDKKFCQSLLLPLGPNAPAIFISTKLFNKIWATWDIKKRSFLAGEFAQALRELRIHKIDLGNLPQVNASMAESCYTWLDLYEAKLVEYGIKQKEAHKALTLPQSLQLPPKPESQNLTLYDRVLLVAVKEYIIMAGPMGSAEKIAGMAKCVARACTED